MPYTVYILRCSDHSLYTGIAADLKKRMNEHFSGCGRAAKYTRSHPPRALAAAWMTGDRRTASRLEYELKRLSKLQKESLVAGGALEFFVDPSLCADTVRIPDGQLPEYVPVMPEM